MSLFGVAARVAQRAIALPTFHQKVPPALKIGTLYGLAVSYCSKAAKLRPNFINPNCGFNDSLIRADITSPQCGVGIAKIKLSSGDYNVEDYANSANTAHGGLQASLHDLAGCKAVMSQGHHGATRTLLVNYTSSASLATAKLLEARAQVVDVRDGKATVESVLKQNDQVISTADMVFKIWSKDLSLPAEPKSNENGGNIDSSLWKYSKTFSE